MTNVMAADAAAQLDVVHTLDVCWCTGDEGPRPYDLVRDRRSGM